MERKETRQNGHYYSLETFVGADVTLLAQARHWSIDAALAYWGCKIGRQPISGAKNYWGIHS
jgi:hypothetical protein